MRKWIERFGLGFHPDTRGEDYVNADGSRVLTDDEVKQYEFDIDEVFEKMHTIGMCAYCYAIMIMKELDLI